MLLPRKPDHHTQAAGRGSVNEAQRRDGVDTNRVHSCIGNSLEIPLDDLLLRKWLSRMIGLECSVSDPPDPEFIVAGEQKLAMHPQALHLCSIDWRCLML